MKVVLRQDLSGLGKRGDIVSVADGHGRNFLLPKGLAFPATPAVATQATAMRRARDLRDAKDRESAEQVARRLVPAVIRLEARAGASGRLFGSITPADIVEAVAAQTGVQLDRRRLHLEEPIRSVGLHEVPVKLHPEVEFRVTVEVAAGH